MISTHAGWRSLRKVFSHMAETRGNVCVHRTQRSCARNFVWVASIFRSPNCCGNRWYAEQSRIHIAVSVSPSHDLGSRILGLGDLGANGLPISIGKLDLYVICGGLRPSSTVPICLDLGTNTKKYLEDPLYLGVRRPRPQGPEVSLQSFNTFDI